MKDYIVLKDYESDWREIFLYNHELTNGEIERAEKVIQEVKDTNPEYQNTDIEEALDKVLPYESTIILSDYDTYNTFWY